MSWQQRKSDAAHKRTTFERWMFSFLFFFLSQSNHWTTKISAFAQSSAHIQVIYAHDNGLKQRRRHKKAHQRLKKTGDEKSRDNGIITTIEWRFVHMWAGCCAFFSSSRARYYDWRFWCAAHCYCRWNFYYDNSRHGSTKESADNKTSNVRSGIFFLIHRNKKGAY